MTERNRKVREPPAGCGDRAEFPIVDAPLPEPPPARCW
jgi:hypothetical protein